MLATKTVVRPTLGDRVRAYAELMKLRLSLLVAFSAAFGYVLAVPGPIDVLTLTILCVSGFLLSGASTTINQIQERDVDGLMKRTQNRPLPTERVTPQEASWLAGISAVASLGLLLVFTNVLTTALALLSLVLYSFVYTPLKKVSPIAVLVGAFPGAMPPLLGWVAATGIISPEALVIFGIQFIWQFPHFWAIAWVADDDYKRAGFKLLPSGGGKDMRTAVQIMTYTLFLIPLGLLPLKLGITGIDSAIVATVCGVLFLGQTFSLMIQGTRRAALRIMFSSFIYLPVVQIAYLLDKI
ncbi:MAG: heme o synthase [Tunicatimonas sp.]